MDRNRFDLTEDERFALNHMKRRLRYENGRFIYRAGSRSNYELIDMGVADENTDYESLIRKVLPHVSERYFTLSKQVLNVNSSLISKLTKFAKYQPFNPPHMQPITCNRKFPKRKITLKNYPKCIPDLPKMLGIVDGMRRRDKKKPLERSILGINYGTKYGKPHAAVTGVTSNGYLPNLKKIEANHITPLRKIEPKEHLAILARMYDLMNMTSSQRMKFEEPSFEKLADALKSYNTASGYVPWSNGPKKPPMFGNTQYINEPHRAKKGDIADFMASFVLDNFGEIKVLIDKGEICTKPFLGESINVEEWKWEILNCLEAGDKATYEKMHEKLRLFFIESANYTLLSMILLKPIHKFLVGGPFGLAMGINAGSFKAMARELLAQGKKDRVYGDVHLPREDYAKLDFIYDLYPELIERISIELDISAFDQSLLYEILVVVALYYVGFYDYKDDPLARILMADMGYRLCVKYLHMLGIDRAFVVLGMMFSGKFETSTGNTLYQVYVFVSYIHHKLKMYADHPKIHLLHIAWEYCLINFKFQGDDLGGAYPKVLRDLFDFTYDDYSAWCLKYGLIVKKGSDKKAIVGRSYFYSINGVWEENVDKHVEGIVFLKNQVCLTYENDIMVGILPYRPSYDLVFRLGNSDKSSETIEGVYAKTLSIAMISLGNREVYDICERLFRLVMKKATIDYDMVEVAVKNMSRGSSAFYHLVQEGMSYTAFPDLWELRMRHEEERIPVRYILNNFASGVQMPYN
jgi:hypothetical protein